MASDAKQKKESQNKKWLNNRDTEAMAAVTVAAMAEAMVAVTAATEDMAEVKAVMVAKADTEAKAADHGVRSYPQKVFSIVYISGAGSWGGNGGGFGQNGGGGWGGKIILIYLFDFIFPFRRRWLEQW